MIKKILVFSFSFIGDAVLSTVVISPLRRHFPNAKITFLVGVRAFDPDLIGVDQVLVYDNLGEHAGWRGKIRLIKFLRREGFDIVVDLRDSLWSRFVGGKHWGTRLRRGDIHAVTRYLDVLQRHGLDGDGARPQLQFTASSSDFIGMLACPDPIGGTVSAKHDAFRFYRDRVDRGQVLVGIHPGGNWIYKLWGPENFAQIADRLCKEWNAQILLFAGPNERQLQAEVASLMHRQPICVKEDDLRQVAALIAACDLYIGNDTGPMHIAVAVGTPVVAIFGSTNHYRSGPYGEEHIVVHSGVELGCNPCHPGKRPGGCGKGSCAVIEAVTVEQVFNAAEKLKHRTG